MSRNSEVHRLEILRLCLQLLTVRDNVLAISRAVPKNVWEKHHYIKDVIFVLYITSNV